MNFSMRMNYYFKLFDSFENIGYLNYVKSQFNIIFKTWNIIHTPVHFQGAMK